MESLKRTLDVVRRLVEEYAAEWKPHDGTRVEAVTDSTHGHFQIIRTGWKDGCFVHRCLVHLALRGHEVHLLKNDTEVEWDRELIDRGVPAEDIVLAFRKSVSVQATPAMAAVGN